MDYKEYWQQIYRENDNLRSLISSYWNQYSDMGNWQFWLVLSFLLLPLILLYFTIDRKRIFEIFFFGFTVHMLWTYIDLALARNNAFVHTYFLSPLYPSALSMTASALPVGYLLLYQYCSSNKKNFYFYALLLSALFAFGFVSVEEFIGLVEIRGGLNKFYILLIDIGIAFVAYWFTKLIIKIREREYSG